MSLWFHRLDKITNEIISEFLPWNFLYLPGGFLEAFWGFLQASLFMILHTKSPRSPKSFHEAPRKLQKNSGQKSRNNFVGIFVQTMKPKGHFEINWPLADLVNFPIYYFRSSIVNNRTQAVVCDDLGITEYALFAVPKKDLKVKDRADLLEAFLGALYVDKDLEYCQVFAAVCFFPR